MQLFKYKLVQKSQTYNYSSVSFSHSSFGSNDKNKQIRYITQPRHHPIEHKQ